MSTYSPTDWQDDVTENSAAAQNKQEKGIQDAHKELSDHIADFVAQPADCGTTGGTSTTYTLTSDPAPTVFKDRMGAVFTAHADSGASPSLAWGTLAAKPALKANGSAAIFKKDAVYTVRYSAAKDSFILQGEGGGGNATAPDLLVSKTASTDAGDIVGTMPDRSGDTAALSSAVSGTTLRLRASDGYRDGVNDYVTITDADFIAGNVRYGKEIFGITGTVGGTAVAADILAGKTAAVNGGDTTGTMPNKAGSATVITPGTVDQVIPQGYFGGAAGDGKVLGSAYLVSGNIRAGITLFNVAGKTEVVDTSEGSNPIAADKVLSGYNGWVNGARVVGNIASKAAASYTPGTVDQTINAGQYLSGAQTILGDADLTGPNIRSGVNIFGVLGSYDTEGTSPAAATHILSGKIAFVNGGKLTGTMPDNGAVTMTPGTVDQTIAAGYHNGSGKVLGSAALVTGNIRSGVSIFGVNGKASVVDTADANAVASDIKSGQTAYVNGVKVTGSMTVYANGAHVTGVDYASGVDSDSVNYAFIKPTAGFYDGTSVWARIRQDTLITGNIRAGINILGVNGKTSVVDTADANAVAGDMLASKTAYVNGALVTGNIASKAATAYTPTTVDQTISANQYLSGAQTVKGDANLLIGNIRAGVSIFGVSGKASVVDTADANATAAQIRAGQTAYVNGSKITGGLTVQATTPVTVTPTTSNIVKSAGIYDGAITIFGEPSMVTGNIRAGVSIFGVPGKTSVVDTADANAQAAHILANEVAYVNGTRVVGTMPQQMGGEYGGWQRATVGAASVDGRIHLKVPLGAYLSAGNEGQAGIFADDPNFVGSNLRGGGRTYFGLAGTMPEIGAVTQSLPVNGTYTIPAGYHNGSGYVTQNIATKGAQVYTPTTTDQTISASQYLTGVQTIKGDANFVESNIKSGVTMWGKTGTVKEGDYKIGDTVSISTNPTLYAPVGVPVGLYASRPLFLHGAGERYCMVNGVNYDMINIGCPVQLSYQSSASGFNGTTVDDLDILWYDSSGSAIGIRLADGTSPPSRVLAGGNGVGNMHFSAPEQAMYTSTYDSTVKKWNKDFSSLTWSCNIGGNSVWMTRWSVVTPTDYIYAYKYVGEYSGELYKINKQTGVKTLMATNGSGYANIIGVESDGSVYLYNKYGDLTKFTDAGGVVFSISLSNGRSNPYSFDYAIITTDKIIVSDNDGQTYFNQTAIVNKQTGVVEKYFNRNGCIVDFQLSSSGKRAYYCLYRNSLTAYMHIGLMSLTL